MSDTKPEPSAFEHYTPIDAELGPCMAALTDKQRKFVWELLANGGDQTKAFKAAGYSINNNPAQVRSNASKLAHSDVIQAAILEEGHKFAGARIGVWMENVEKIALDPTESGATRLKALDMLLSRGGSLSKTEVVHSRSGRELTEEQLLQKVKASAEKLGVDPKTLLSKYGYVEAEFTVVEETPALPAPSGADNADLANATAVDDWMTWTPEDNDDRAQTGNS